MMYRRSIYLILLYVFVSFHGLADASTDPVDTVAGAAIGRNYEIDFKILCSTQEGKEIAPLVLKKVDEKIDQARKGLMAAAEQIKKAIPDPQNDFERALFEDSPQHISSLHEIQVKNSMNFQHCKTNTHL